MKKLLIIVIILTIVGIGSQYGKNLIFRIGLQKMDMKSDLWDINMENLVLNKKDMQNVCYGIGYEFFLNNNMSINIEGGTYQKTHFSSYREYTFNDGSPIEQNIKLSISSVEFNINFLPIGFRKNIYPYLSVGGGLYFWTYEQWDNFINFEDDTVFEGYASTRTTSFGGNAKAGIVIRVGKELGFSVEGKYRYLKGHLSSGFEGFGDLDLNGWSYSLGIHLFIW